MGYKWSYEVNKYADKYEVYLVGEDFSIHKVCETDDERLAKDIAHALAEKSAAALGAYCERCGVRINQLEPRVAKRDKDGYVTRWHVECYER